MCRACRHRAVDLSLSPLVEFGLNILFGQGIVPTAGDCQGIAIAVCVPALHRTRRGDKVWRYAFSRSA